MATSALPRNRTSPRRSIVYFIDMVDSKTCDLGEELALVKVGESTAPIGVLDKERFYKHKLSE
ncbi:MAG: hypothetical protein MZU97_24075 [Bacillus subtilis]|nr:hypothetical protein [Bacillus subtilis]